MTYATFPSGPFQTNAYVVSCPETKQAVIIDPAPGSASKIAEYIEKEGLKPKEIWLTHSHWDHIADIEPVKKLYSIPLAVHPLDKENLESPGSDGIPCWISIAEITPNHLLKEGEILTLGSMRAIVIHTPGHSPGGVCYYFPEQGLLFSGDTLFQGTIGNLSFPTCQPSLMWKSLEKLAALPPATVVLPGHGPATQIGKEKWLKNAEEVFG